jgi:hypothetical protein
MESVNSLIVGQFCIARCGDAGVHAGEVVQVEGSTAVLKNSRRMWSWEANGGAALSGAAQHGVNAGKSIIDTANPVIYLTGVCELIPCSEASRLSIVEA